MADRCAGVDPRPAGLSVCILACKDLSLNMRAIRQARSLVQAGHRATIVGFRTPDPRLTSGEEAATLVATGAPPYPALLMSKLWLTRHLLRSDAGQRRGAEAGVAAGRSRNARFADRVAVRLAERPFDVVQAHFDKALIAASALARRCGAKLVFDAVEVPFDQELLPLGPIARTVRLAEIRREMEIARQADGWITVNGSLADNIVERFGVKRPLVLRNFQDAGHHRSDGRLRRLLGLTDDARILLHLNTMRRGEGVETAIDALAHLPPEFHLVGLGPAPQRGFLKALRRRATERGVADRFHLAPMQPPHAVLAYIAGADIGIIAREGTLQNLRLGLPNRLFQMIAARLPVVATPLPEITQVVTDWRIGLPFEERNPVGLAAAVRRLSEPAAWNRFRHAVERAARSLTWEEESAPYVRFIENLPQAAPAETGPSRTWLQVAAGE